MWAVASGDIGKQMFLSWKSSSWILDCVYIPSRYAMWKCLERGNSVPAEQIKGMRWKKITIIISWETCQIPRFCAWFAHPADVSAQVSLLIFSSYTVCQTQMHIHMNEELVPLMVSEIPTVRDVTQSTHAPTARRWVSTVTCCHFSRQPQVDQCWRLPVRNSICIVLSAAMCSPRDVKSHLY